MLYHIIFDNYKLDFFKIDLDVCQPIEQVSETGVRTTGMAATDHRNRKRKKGKFIFT